MSDALFTYGTLQFPEVMEAVTGLALPWVEAEATGFAQFRFRDRIYPGMVAREGALFAFSVEALPKPGYQLTPSGRYAHGRPYISRLAAAAGLREVTVTREQLRYEYGEPVMGDIWVFEKLPSP